MNNATTPVNMGGNNNPIPFKELFPNMRGNTIMTGSEMYFIYALNQHALALAGRPIDISGLAFSNAALKSYYASFLVAASFPLPTKVVEMIRKYSGGREFSTAGALVPTCLTINATREGIAQDGYYEFEYSITPAYTMDKVHMVGSFASSCYISVVAMNIIRGYVQNCKVRTIIDVTRMATLVQNGVDVCILAQYGNQFINNKTFQFKYESLADTQFDYRLYTAYNHQCGYMSKNYTPSEKFRWASRAFQVGDVVLLYKTSTPDKHSTLGFKPLVSCHPAVVQEITKDGIRLTEYPLIKTRIGRRREVENAQRLTNLFTEADKTNFVSATSMHSWESLGVERFTYSEGKFILRPIEDSAESFEQWLFDGEKEVTVRMQTFDVIYAVFEDWGVRYNKERFLEQYFPNGKLPIYETYRRMAYQKQQERNKA